MISFMKPMTSMPRGQYVAVATMGGSQRVLRLQRAGNAGGHCFLTDAEVNETRHLVVGEQACQCRFDVADQAMVL